MKLRTFIAMMFLAGFAWMLLVNAVFRMLNFDSDLSFMLGIVVLLMSFIIFPSIIASLYRRLK